ncbi:hypothetical protein HRR83_005037 [Exophiala dermatitidis]|nr:hypothetical protein HRR74_004799 [Exophiala dermatitidis]KAJ4519773.1 hypothetical protein HRR73_003833 [Exophiala dermatitidis]KAJ4534425.1 hypothetical protein HRR76_006349 [Exophiala dermatitidis]KAJ4573342.1 hypothetical protein HRR81_004829 [Exophiala dermatitidis]KAJ4595308.1 hypothetical protein HRR84_005515 [Exophiala dermatitidis]
MILSVSRRLVLLRCTTTKQFCLIPHASHQAGRTKGTDFKRKMERCTAAVRSGQPGLTHFGPQNRSRRQNGLPVVEPRTSDRVSATFGLADTDDPWGIVSPQHETGEGGRQRIQ